VSILLWDKPRQRVSKAKWKEEYGFEDGPTGGYQPNMSEDDERRWKAKVVGTKTGFPQVEVRKKAGASLMTIIVNLGDGYNYKYYNALPNLGENTPKPKSYCETQEDADYFDLCGGQTPGTNVHISMNGPSTFSFEEISEMTLVIEEAKDYLANLIGPGERKPFVAYVDGDPGEVGKTIDAIDGAKFHYALQSLKLVVFTSTANALIDIARMPEVSEVLTKADAVEREEAAYDKRHGYD
jgi:hypothetical protein